jgi:hypothetical protein
MATCDTCGAPLTPIEAAGRETGRCNDCLRTRFLGTMLDE